MLSEIHGHCLNGALQEKYTVVCKSLHTASFQFSDFQLKSFVDPKPVEL